MEYKRIFKQDVLDILLAKLREPVKRLSKTDLLRQAYEVLPIIQKIEADYIDPLEDLAVQVVKDAYPIVNDLNIKYDVSITKNPDFNINESEDDEPSLGDLKRRRVLNAITQGAATRGTSIYHMLIDELNIIDERLVPAYNKILQSVFGIYDLTLTSLDHDFNVFENKKNSIITEDSMHMGKVKVSYSVGADKRTLITIKAQAVCFPFLIHEIVKGIYQSLSSQGWKNLSLQRKQNIQQKVDTPEYEFNDIKFGKYIYDALNKIVSDYTSDSSYDARVRDFFLVDLYQMENPTQFVNYIQNAIREDLDDEQIAWTKSTIRDIISDLKADDADDALNEMKVHPIVNLIKNYKGGDLILNTFTYSGDDVIHTFDIENIKNYKYRDFDIIKYIPENFHVTGNLDITGNAAITTLPRGLKIDGYLFLRTCTSLITLPDDLKVGKSLTLYNCNSLTTLPEGLKVNQSFVIHKCNSLTTLPKGLKVDADLFLDDCTNFTTLPDDLEVGRNLLLYSCNKLKEIPRTIKVGGKVFLPKHLVPEHLRHSNKNGFKLHSIVK